jgi:hypothetical protein
VNLKEQWLQVAMVVEIVSINSEAHRKVSLLVEAVKEDNRTNSIVPPVCHSIDTATSISPCGEIVEYKNSIKIQMQKSY